MSAHECIKQRGYIVFWQVQELFHNHAVWTFGARIRWSLHVLAFLKKLLTAWLVPAIVAQSSRTAAWPGK